MGCGYWYTRLDLPLFFMVALPTVTKSHLRQRLLHVISSLRRENRFLKHQSPAPIRSQQSSGHNASNARVDPPSSDSISVPSNQTAVASPDVLFASDKTTAVPACVKVSVDQVHEPAFVPSGQSVVH